MRGLSLFLVLGFVAEWGAAQFLNNRPYPTYSLESMPDTGFTCRDKVLGGYYADPETQCQMFHVCVKVAGVGVQDFRFLCPNGTAFDQDHQICAEWDDVDCDATTLYYSSDNFDLYRLGSGFESKAVKYGEEEETFALQRAETGDARLNREHQAQRVNQKKEFNTAAPFRKHNNYQSQPKQDNIEKDIFKGASSSNFYNNRNGGKEVDDEYDDKNVNLNQDHDYEQKKKLNRKSGRRPQPQNYNQNNQNQPQQSDASTQRPSRPTGFLNNFAGSIVTTPKSASTGVLTNEQYTVAPNRGRNGRIRPNTARQHNDGNNFKQNNNDQLNNNDQSTFTQQFQSPQYTISTPAPFRQTQQNQQQNNIPSKQTTQFNTKVQYVSTTSPPKQQQTSKQTENYPSTSFQQKPTFQQRQTDNYPSTVTQPKQAYSSTAPQQKQHTETENYPSSFPKQQQSNNYPTTPVGNSRNTQSYDNSYDVPKIKRVENYGSTNENFEYKKQSTQFKQTDNYPTTFSPKTNRLSTFNTQSKETYPSTFSPRTNAGYTQISQQTTHQQQQNTQDYTQNSKQSTQFNAQKQSSTYNQQTQYTSNSTPRPSPFTQYTPTVPKISSTTPVTRSNRFDETQYDDGSYNSKYDNYDKKDSNEEEFLKTAHSLNIASSRNELAKSTKLATVTTSKPQYESPRPFSVSANTPKVTDFTSNVKPTTQNVQSSSSAGNAQQAKPTKKKDKNASYDYAYYDSNLGGESEYEIDTEFQKSTPK